MTHYSLLQDEFCHISEKLRYHCVKIRCDPKQIDWCDKENRIRCSPKDNCCRYNELKKIIE